MGEHLCCYCERNCRTVSREQVVKYYGPFRGFDTYSPSIIKGFGFESRQSNAMASVGLFL